MQAIPLQTLAEVTAAHGAKVGSPSAPAIAHVEHDSRTLTRGALFVALRGEHHDGHAFVDQAVQAGAAALLVDARAVAAGLRLPDAIPVLVVEDTLRALQDIACYVRQQSRARVVGVTGSNGKTTTRELCAATLAVGGPVHQSRSNLNNHIGLPMTLLACPAEAWVQVLEMGMSAPGEIRRLAAIARPDVALVTCVAEAHLGGPGLGSLAAIAAAKAEIFESLGPQGTAVINLDDRALAAALAPLPPPGRRVGFGRHPEADVRLMACEPTAHGMAVELTVAGHGVRCVLPMWGRHHGMNAAAAAAVGHALGLEAEAMARALPQVAPPHGRLEMRQAERYGLTLLDDTYNANPGSMRAAVETLQLCANGRRTLAVVGDMLELGPRTAELHERLGRLLVSRGVTQVWAMGERARDVCQGVRQEGGVAFAFRAAEPLIDALQKSVQDGDVVLVKGSRGMHMERVVEALCRQEGAPRAEL